MSILDILLWWTLVQHDALYHDATVLHHVPKRVAKIQIRSNYDIPDGNLIEYPSNCIIQKPSK